MQSLIYLLIITTIHALQTTSTDSCNQTNNCIPSIFQSYNLTSRATSSKGLNWILGDELNGGLDRNTFFRQYYEKVPVVIKRNPSIANYYGDLFPFSAVSTVVDNFPDQRKLDDWVIVNKNFVTKSKYTKVTEIYDAYLQGNTLGMFILNRLYPQLGVLVDDLDRDFGFPWRVNLYLTPNGAKGFLPHTDQHDFFILQTGGKKKWRVYGNPIPLNTRNQEQGKKSGKPLREKDLGTPVLEVVLNQGDALYVPRGFIHVAETFEETGSLHLTVRGTNSFFFNMGHVFNKMLPTPPKALGLPALNTLQEFDIDFRRSTPVHWLNEKNKETQHALIKYGVKHGGDVLNICSPTVKDKKKKCTLTKRWLAALMRASAKHRRQTSKTRKNVRKASRIKIKKWVQDNINIPKCITSMNLLRNKINVEHHKLLKHVETIFNKKKTSMGLSLESELMTPSFPLHSYVRIRKGIEMVEKKSKRKTGKGWKLMKKVTDDQGNVILKSHLFQYSMKSILEEVVEWSKKSMESKDIVHFQVKNGFEHVKDDFQLISLMNVLNDLRFVDKLEVSRQEEPRGEKEKKKGRKKVKGDRDEL